jgi:Holliday junction resolvase RusA-like endonuclease
VIRFTLDIPPQSGQFGKRLVVMPNGKPRFFSDARKERFQRQVATLAQRFAPIEPMDGPLQVDLVFVVSRPKRLCRKCDPDGLIPCDVRPDRINCGKLIEDALAPCGFWHDDAQIADGRVAKFYAERDGSPRIEVTIAPINPLTENYQPGELPGMILK